MMEAIVFDFDGIITQSNDIRTNTYFDILNPVSGSKEAMKKAITEDSKRDRYGIIKAALQKLSDKGLMQFTNLEQETKKYVNMYNEITEKEVSIVPEVPGAKKALMQLSQKYPLFIITGTLQKSLDIVMQNRKLSKYFRKAYGDFRDKIDGMNTLLKEHGFNPKKTVFVGDSKADYECAKHYDMPFVAILNETNDFEMKEDIKWKLYDLEKLPEMIEVIEKEIGD